MIEEKYQHFCKTPSDINEHLPTLYKYALECNHITEMGVRDVVSTWAFLMAKPKKLKCYDIHKSQNIDEAIIASDGVMEFTESDVLTIEIEPTELLFIDTLHTYTQLKKELALHAKNVSKYIILHDTVTYGQVPEPASWQTLEIMKNYVQNDRGIKPAISDFLEWNLEWAYHEHFDNNNGLLIIKKI